MTEIFDTKEQTAAEAQAEAQYQSLCSMLDAVDVDYDRLEELKDSREALREEFDAMPENAGIDFDRWVCDMAGSAWSRDEQDELEMLQADAGDCTDEDDARQSISEDPLEVTVRSGWVTPGEEMTADDFQILLCTGGPAVRIMGELDQHGTPCRAWMEYQDWGTPWTQYFGAEQSRLLAYAQHFFG